MRKYISNKFDTSFEKLKTLGWHLTEDNINQLVFWEKDREGHLLNGAVTINLFFKTIAFLVIDEHGYDNSSELDANAVIAFSELLSLLDSFDWNIYTS